MLEDYALSCLRVGRELHVPVIDLHACSFRTLCDMGPEITPDYFMDTTLANKFSALCLRPDCELQEIEVAWKRTNRWCQRNEENDFALCEL